MTLIKNVCAIIAIGLLLYVMTMWFVTDDARYVGKGLVGRVLP
jgi:hypothetical protein